MLQVIRSTVALFFFLVASILFAVGGLLTMAYDCRVIASAYATNSWQGVDARVISSKIVKQEGRSIAYNPEVCYSYVVCGKTYVGSTIWIRDYGDSESYAQDVVNSCPPNGVIRIFYDPSFPAHAVLRQGINRQMFFEAGVGAMTCALGVWLFPAKRFMSFILGS